MLSIISKNITYKENTTKWIDFPEPIERMEFQVNSKESIIMEGFDFYLRTMENEYGVMNSKFCGIGKIYLFGRALGKTAVVDIDCKTGKVKNYIVEQGEEPGQKLSPTVAWKKGISGISRVFKKEV